MSRYDGEIGHSLICVCDEGYTGEHCDQCAPGYFGNSHEKGGSCIQCECNGRIDTNDLDASVSLWETRYILSFVWSDSNKC